MLATRLCSAAAAIAVLTSTACEADLEPARTGVAPAFALRASEVAAAAHRTAFFNDVPTEELAGGAECVTPDGAPYVADAC